MADIKWSDIVGNCTVSDGGYVGCLMQLASAHINAAVEASRITQDHAGEVYTTMIPAAMQHGIGFAMQDELTEAEIEKALAETVVVQQKIVGRKQLPAESGD